MREPRTHRRAWRFGALALTAGLIGSLAPSMGAGADSGVLPTFDATLGGPLHAEMYPSGMEVGPDGSIVIADTGNNQVAKYTAAGTQVWRVGSHGSGTNQFTNPRDIGIDSANNVYVADSRNNRIVKLNGSTGAWLTSFGGPTNDKISFPLGVSVTGDKVYAADTGKNSVRVFDTAGVQLRKVVAATGVCAFSGPRDADGDSAGNIYLANYKVNNVVKFSPTGICDRAWGTTGSGDGQFKALYGVRIARDPVLNAEAVYVADANNNRIQEFTTAGVFVAAVGVSGPATTPGTFFQLRRVAVAADGDVWGADLWGSRLVRFDRIAGGYTYSGQTIGTLIGATTPTAVFQEPHGIAFDSTGDIYVADTVHHRIVVMNSNGTIDRTCGMRGSAAGQFNWPRGVAVDQATGQIWVANTKQYNLHILNADCSPVMKFGVFGAAADQFNWPHSITIRPSDRIAFVADTMNHRIKVYNVATRALIGMFGAKGAGVGQFNEPAGITVDPTNGHILVADTKNNRVVELSDSGGSNITWVRSMTGGFLSPQGVAATNSHIFVADSGNNRVAILAKAEGVVTGTFTNPSLFDSPENVAVDASNRILVADTYKDRIQRYLPYASTATPDTTAPSSAISTPTKNQSLPNAPITISGTATDNVNVATVKVAIQNLTSKLWWRGGTTWGAFQLNTANVATSGATSTGWSLTWTPPAGAGSYGVQSESTDAAGNRQPTPKPWVPFGVTG